MLYKEDFGEGFFAKSQNTGVDKQSKNNELLSSSLNESGTNTKLNDFLSPFPTNSLSTRRNSKFSEIVIPGKTPLRMRNTPRNVHHHGL